MARISNVLAGFGARGLRRALRLGLALGLAGPAAAAPQGDPAAIMAAMKAAAGGTNWDQVTSLHVELALRSGGETGRIDRWEDVAAGRFVQTATWPGRTTIYGFDGVSPWYQGRSRVAYLLGDRDAALAAADEAYRVSRAWFVADRHPATVAWAGLRTEAGRVFDVLAITPEGGRMFEAWVDRATHLLARTDEQQAEDRVVTTYSDYRMVQGVMLPFTIRSGDGTDESFDEVDRVQAVTIDAKPRPGAFALPPLPAPDIVLPAGADSVALPFRLTADNRILVPVVLDGKQTVQAQFDSGGGFILQPATVAAMALPATGRAKETGGGEGAIAARHGAVADLAIGAAHVRGLEFKAVGFAPDAPERAIIGLEILQRFVVRLDFDRQVMTLTRPQRFAYAGSGTVLPFHFQDNQPEVNGEIDGIAGLFAMDTGDGGSLLLIAPFARRHGLAARYRADVPYAGRAIGPTNGVWARRRVGTVSFDGADGRPVAEVQAPVTRISLQHAGFDAHPYVAANIGMGILKQFNLTFDYPRRQIILERNGLYGAKDVFDRAGLRLTRSGQAWAISTVYTIGPAAEAGLAVGESVTRIDGQTPATLDDDALWQKLLASPGTKLDLQLGERHVTLVLRDFL